jgi:H+/Cl- antiporter ClcA
MFLFYVVLGAVFSAVAALCAFFITYEEYLKHYPDKRTPLKMAAKTSLVAFAFFMFVSVSLNVIINLFL